jgi:hypothetical protein
MGIPVGRMPWSRVAKKALLRLGQLLFEWPWSREGIGNRKKLPLQQSSLLQRLRPNGYRRRIVTRGISRLAGR